MSFIRPSLTVIGSRLIGRFLSPLSSFILFAAATDYITFNTASFSSSFFCACTMFLVFYVSPNRAEQSILTLARHT